MEVDAGDHGVLRSPSWLISPSTGEVLLRLFPRHVERLHSAEQRGTYAPCGRDIASPYTSPLLKDSEPMEVRLHGGLAPHEVTGGLQFENAGEFQGRSWWRWIAAALTPFGWVNNPTPHFLHGGAHENGALHWLTLTPSCEDQLDGRAVAGAWLAKELGEAHASPPGGRGNQPLPTWTYDWGAVRLGSDIDSFPRISVEWNDA